MPLFSGFSVTNRVKESEYLELKTQADKLSEERVVKEQALRAKLDLQSLKAQIKALSDSVKSSQLSLKAAGLGYRSGVRTNLDVLNAQSQLFNTQRDLAKARYDIFIALLNLRKATGLLNADDLVQINRFLIQ